MEEAQEAPLVEETSLEQEENDEDINFRSGRCYFLAG